VAAAVILREGRVLVQTRPDPGRWQGYWEFPGGGIEAGEDISTAARRECLEELGLAVSVQGPLDVVRWAYGARRVEVYFVRCAVDGAGEATAREGQQHVRWVAADELATLRFLPANARVVERVVELLSS